MTYFHPHRRALIAGAAALLAAPRAFAATKVVMHKDPNCGCCGAWAKRLEAAGYAVETRPEARMDMIKSRLGVPDALASCHTALVEGYVLEGHVPVEALAKLLAERPRVAGLAVPGMPMGSPGMEAPGETPDPFQVLAFAAGKPPAVFMDYPRGYTVG